MLLTISLLHATLVHGLTGAVGVLSEEGRLLNDLLANYNRHAKPTVHSKDQMEVQVSFGLARLEDLNEKQQVMTTFGWLTATWMDELLVWDPADYNGTEKVTLEGKEIWLPEVAIMNTIVQGNDLAYEAKFRVSVSYNGAVFWGPGFKWETSCNMDLTYFPYDEHLCSVQFINWVYGEDQLIYTKMYNLSEVIVDNMEKNGEWELLKTEVTTQVLQSDFADQILRAPGIRFTLHLRRLPAYYLWNVVIPCVMMTFLSALMYITPAESGEKIGLAVTVLLGFSVILLMVSDITPQNGDSMPLITQYIVFSMGTTAICLFLTLLVLNLHHHRADKPMPRSLQSFLLHYLASAVCLHRSRLCPACKDTPTPSSSSSNRRTRISPQDPPNSIMIVEDITQQKPAAPPTSPSHSALWLSNEDVLTFLRARVAREGGEGEGEGEGEARTKQEWQQAAAVMDRFLLFVTFSGIAVMTMCYMLIIMS